MPPSLHQVLADCPHCRVQAAVVELHRVGGAGRPIEARCRLCRYALGPEGAVAPAPFADGRAVAEALARWAAEEGDDDLERFCAANFGGLSSREVAERVLRGEPVETGFDVIAFLFPSAAAAAAVPRERAALGPGADGALRAGVRTGRTLTHLGFGDPRAPHAAPPPPERAERRWSPADGTRALVSVMVADGAVRPAEEGAVAEALARLGLPAPEPAERRVWRPNELAVPPEPAGLLAACRRVALADGEADATEVRLLDEYARAWSTPLDRAGLGRPTLLDRLDRTLRGLLFA